MTGVQVPWNSQGRLVQEENHQEEMDRGGCNPAYSKVHL